MSLFAPCPPPYELRCVCLWLEEEADARLAMAVKDGIGLALSPGSVPLRYYRAAADTAAEAARRCNVANRARQEAAAGFGK